jgi:DNA-directed RNA polymerase subunit L
VFIGVLESIIYSCSIAAEFVLHSSKMNLKTKVSVDVEEEKNNPMRLLSKVIESGSAVKLSQYY